jgi:hypothetical protein
MDALGNVHGAMMCNAGVMVKNGDKRRFTTAQHCWDAVEDKVVYHAEQAIGRIIETLGDDVGLVDCPFDFSNELLDIDVTAQVLKKAEEFSVGDFFLMDSAFTGKQRLKMFGVRAGKKRAKVDGDGRKEDYDYVMLEQGVYSVESPIMDQSPMIREGVCGTPIIHVGKKIQEEKDHLAEGVVGGFMCYSDTVIATSPKAQMLYCYCQTTDELLDAGWSICND